MIFKDDFYFKLSQGMNEEFFKEYFQRTFLVIKQVLKGIFFKDGHKRECVKEHFLRIFAAINEDFSANMDIMNIISHKGCLF